MNGTCQTCGTTAPLTWFLSEVERRQICAVLVNVPKDVQEVVFHYLSLFRPATGRALQGKKATRLLMEIKELTGKGFVHVQGRVDRDCPARIWAQAMEQMVERREGLTLPLPNHIYLCKVAYDLAEQTNRQAETKTEAERTHARTRPAEERRGIDPLEKARQRWDAEHGTPDGTTDLGGISTIVKGIE